MEKHDISWSNVFCYTSYGQNKESVNPKYMSRKSDRIKLDEITSSKFKKNEFKGAYRVHQKTNHRMSRHVSPENNLIFHSKYQTHTT